MTTTATTSPVEQARFNMIEQQVRPWNVLDATVLGLLASVPREQFVPAAHRGLAFADTDIPIGHGQYMLAPRLQARLLQDLKIKKTDKVLEIGTGSGYMAALMGSLAQRVLSLEIEPQLANQARDNLQRVGMYNVDVRQADGAQGAPADGPFDVILLGGSVAHIPSALLEQLQIGGRLAAIVGDEPVMAATIVTRSAAQQFDTTTPWDTVAPRLRNFAESAAFEF